MKKSRWFYVSLIVLSCLVLIPSAGQTAKFPDRPITLYVPYGAGGATDIAIRPLAEAAQKTLGQPVIVDNKPGAGGAVSVGAIVGKPADGYLLSVAVTSLHRNSYINKFSFDTVKDVTPIIRVGGYLYGILVHPDSPFKTLKDLTDYAKANPGKLKYMASGVGTGGHIAMEELAYNNGRLKFVHIPSKGDAESSTALMGKHVDFISTTSGWIPLVEAKKLRLLAVFTEKRVKKLPNAPTVKELGYKVVQQSPFGIFGPKGMPANVVKTLHDAFKKALSDPTFVKTMDNYGMPVMYQNSADFAKFWAASYKESDFHVKTFIKHK
ncbi:MAG: tripartite tricarboxylate transporter substrate binding protein [Syntrophales bacterium]|nr:tripartite tricarboxylate transporter substrate binding protein [Syntrophales bacterium]